VKQNREFAFVKMARIADGRKATIFLVFLIFLIILFLLVLRLEARELLDGTILNKQTMKA